MYLNQLKVGEKSKILTVLDSDLKRRFMELGIISGNEIECVLQSPFLDPKAYLVKGSLIAIRLDDALTIVVEDV
jgi:ferrous iron transport protein A